MLATKSVVDADAATVESAGITGLEIIVPAVLLVFAVVKLGLAIGAYVVSSRNTWLRSAASDELREIREKSTKTLKTFSESFMLPNADMTLRFREALAGVAFDVVAVMANSDILALAKTAIGNNGIDCSAFKAPPAPPGARPTDTSGLHEAATCTSLLDSVKRADHDGMKAKLIAMLRIEFDDIISPRGTLSKNYALASAVLCVPREYARVRSRFCEIYLPMRPRCLTALDTPLRALQRRRANEEDPLLNSREVPRADDL